MSKHPTLVSFENKEMFQNAVEESTKVTSSCSFRTLFEEFKQSQNNYTSFKEELLKMSN